jgi:hypothetical protein
MIPKKPAPDPIGGGYRFSEKIMLNCHCRRLVHAALLGIAMRIAAGGDECGTQRQTAAKASKSSAATLPTLR